MANKKIKVSIIILTWNTFEMTKLQLKDASKVDTKGLDVEMIIVDNASNDGGQDLLKHYKMPNMKYKFIQTGANLGFAGGNNIGMKDAIKRGADYVILMNNDLILSKDIIKKLVNVAESDETIGTITPKIYFAKGYEFHKDRYKKEDIGKVIWYAGGIIDRDNVYSSHRGVDEVDHGQYDQTVDTDFGSGACLLVTRKAIEKVGYMSESFFLYWEDADYSEQIKRGGFRVVYTPDTKLWHMVSTVTGGSGGPLNEYFLTRNRMIFGLRYSSFRTKFALFRESIKLLFTGREWQKKGVADFYLGRWKGGRWVKKKK